MPCTCTDVWNIRDNFRVIPIRITNAMLGCNPQYHLDKRNANSRLKCKRRSRSTMYVNVFWHCMCSSIIVLRYAFSRDDPLPHSIPTHFVVKHVLEFMTLILVLDDFTTCLAKGLVWYLQIQSRLQLARVRFSNFDILQLPQYQNCAFPQPES